MLYYHVGWYTLSYLSHAQKPFPPSFFVFKVVLRPNADAEWALETGPPSPFGVHPRTVISEATNIHSLLSQAFSSLWEDSAWKAVISLISFLLLRLVLIVRFVKSIYYPPNQLQWSERENTERKLKLVEVLPVWITAHFAVSKDYSSAPKQGEKLISMI